MRVEVLTEEYVQKLRPESKRYEVWETSFRGAQFGLRVETTGRKVFVFRYSVWKGTERIQRRMNLGDYKPDADTKFAVEDARKAARKVLGEISEEDETGKPKDPQGERIAARLKAEAEREARSLDTFRGLWEDYLEKHARPNLRPSWLKFTEYVGTRFLLPTVGDRPLSEFDPADVQEVMDAVLADARKGEGVRSRGGKVLAVRVRGVLSACFSWAMRRYPRKFTLNPVARTEKPLRGRSQSRGAKRRALRTDEVVALWRAVEAEALLTRLMLRFLLYSGQRQIEVKGARWRDMDLGARVWRIPASLYKTGVEQTVPLTPQMVRVLEEVRAISGGGEYVFPGLDGGPRLSVRSARTRLREASGISDLRLHWTRHTCMTTMTEQLGVPQTIADLVLGHTPDDSRSTWVYDHSSYLDQKRRALQAWNDHVDRLVAEAKAKEEADGPARAVVALKEALESKRWIFAKTMPENPHWYTLRKEWDRDEDFVWAVEALRQHGVREKYRGRPYTVIYLNGYKYWTMGAPVPATILINRKPLAGLLPADPEPPEYDALGNRQWPQTSLEAEATPFGDWQSQQAG